LFVTDVAGDGEVITAATHGDGGDSVGAIDVGGDHVITEAGKAQRCGSTNP
jgi:hypothetical protein